jgi:hypothetical protein
MKSNNGILTEKEIQKRTKFWSKKQFRTWSKKELERTSTDMQNLLVAIKGLSTDEIKAIRKLEEYGHKTYVYSLRAYGKKSPEYIICMAGQRDLDYAISIAPKTFKVKQG